MFRKQFFLLASVACFFLLSNAHHAAKNISGTKESISDILSPLLSQEAPSQAPDLKDLPPKIDYIPTSFIVLKVLDKITARVFEIRGQIDREMTFGNLKITPISCFKAPPDEKAESAAYLTIHDVSQGKGHRPIFSGWMFASTPALSTVEHPVYDVWVKECCENENAHPVLYQREDGASDRS